MPYSTLVAGTTITASWANANVRDQVVTPFATTSARGSAITAPIEGMVAPITDDDHLSIYDGSAWVVPVWYASTGRIGVRMTRAAAQSITTNTLTLISWDTELDDEQGFIAVPSDTFSIPAGMGGIYLARLRVTKGTTDALDIVQMDLSGTTYDSYSGAAPTGTHGITFGPNVMTPAQTVKFRVRHQGSTQNMTFGLEMWRIAL